MYIFAIIANFIFLFEGLFAAKYFAKILNLESKTLLPMIILVCMIGSFASANTVWNIFIMIFFGVIGFFLKKVDIPPASMILGLVLGEMAETNFRSAFTMSRGTLGVFFRPLCLIFWALLVRLHQKAQRQARRACAGRAVQVDVTSYGIYEVSDLTIK